MPTLLLLLVTAVGVIVVVLKKRRQHKGTYIHNKLYRLWENQTFGAV